MELVYELPREVLAGDIDATLNFAEVRDRTKGPNCSSIAPTFRCSVHHPDQQTSRSQQEIWRRSSGGGLQLNPARSSVDAYSYSALAKRFYSVMLLTQFLS